MVSSDTRISFEQRYIERFKAMEKGSTSTIEKGFRARIQRLLRSRIDDRHDELALHARRVSTVHDICKEEVESLCAYLSAEKDRCEQKLTSSRPSHVQILIDRLLELSPLLTDLSSPRKLPEPSTDHKSALFQCLWDAQRTKASELHAELLAAIASTCTAFGDPFRKLREEAEENIRTQMPARKAA